MNKQKLLKWWNLLLAFALFGVLLSIALGKITGGEAFFEMHESFGIAFAVLALGHLFLNWGWVQNALGKKKPVKATGKRK
jgi:hypothetical protein